MTIRHILSILKSPRLRHVRVGNILVARIDTTNYGHYFYELSYTLHLAESRKWKVVLLSKNRSSIIRNDKLASHFDCYLQNNLFLLYTSWGIFNISEITFRICGIIYYFMNSYLWRILERLGFRKRISKKLSKFCATRLERFMIRIPSIFERSYLTDYKFFKHALTDELKSIVNQSYFRRDMLAATGVLIKEKLKPLGNVKSNCFVFHYRKNKISDSDSSKRDESIRSVDPSTYKEALNRLCEHFECGYIFGEPEDFDEVQTLNSKLRFFNQQEFGGLEQIRILASAKLFLGCESGPYHVAQILGLDTIVTNATDPVCSFPVKSGSICLMQNLRMTTGRSSYGRDELIAKLCTQGYYDSIRKDRFLYFKNTSTEILYVVNLYLEKYIPKIAYENADIVQRFARGSEEPMVKKWGAVDGCLGLGAIL